MSGVAAFIWLSSSALRASSSASASMNPAIRNLTSLWSSGLPLPLPCSSSIAVRMLVRQASTTPFAPRAISVMNSYLASSQKPATMPRT